MMNLTIRTADVRDAAALLAVYKPYVEKTAVSFEYDTPDTREFARRIENTLQRYPYLVAELDGHIVGYAYASPFIPRAAYGYCAEATIYIDQSKKGLGIGKALYEQLERCLRRQNIINLNACIAYTEQEDEHLTNDSMRFHEHMGYRLVGTFTKCGYKFGKWYDMIWMEKMLSPHPDRPEPFIPFSQW